MKTYFLKSMGCKSNQLEGFLIQEELEKNGFTKSSSQENADYFVLNSCTVTHKSDNEALSILRRAKKKNPCVVNVLTGCVAQIEKAKLLEYPFIDYVFGNDEKLELSKFLSANKKCEVQDIMQLDSFHKVFLHDTSKTRANLKIQDGCDNRCSYCIIPFARGKNRSADVPFILEQIKLYEDAGFKEIVLTGIHIGQWGKDFSEQKALLNLLEQIETKSGIKRYRMGSLNPLEISDEMLSFLSGSQKFCPHFHLSLQSMCDKTLHAMNRFYTAGMSLDLIEKISETFENPFMGSDIIAGFPGESQEDFETTLSNLKRSRLSQIHTFPYSIRKGTVAESMDNHLPDKIKAERASLIKELSAQKHTEFIAGSVGTVQEVIIEKNPDRKTGYLKGLTRNYINVLIKPFNDLHNPHGEVRTVKILDYGSTVSGYCFAELR